MPTSLRGELDGLADGNAETGVPADAGLRSGLALRRTGPIRGSAGSGMRRLAGLWPVSRSRGVLTPTTSHTTRKPMWLLRLSGVFLLRLAKRAFLGCCSRNRHATNDGSTAAQDGRVGRPLEDDLLEQPLPRVECVRVPGVADPTDQPRANRLRPNLAAREQILQPAHAPAKTGDILAHQQSMIGKDPVAQEPRAIVARTRLLKRVSAFHRPPCRFIVLHPS